MTTTYPLSAAERRCADEAHLVMKLVRALLSDGYAVGYNDGEETVVKPSTQPAATCRAIRNELHSTDEGALIIRRPDDRTFRASVALVYGNHPSEVFADWTVPVAHMERIAGRIEFLTDGAQYW